MRILLIEDDGKLCDALRYQLEREGFVVDVCGDGEDGLHFALQQVHELVLLDRMLPSLKGTRVLKKMRDAGIMTPVILITALGALDERVEGLDAGADDYLVKPFATEELLARIRALCRRPRQWENTGCVETGDISLDGAGRVLKGEGGSCTLSKREAALLEVFLKNRNRTLPRELLLGRVWGPDAPVEDGNLDNYIYFLRRRLKSVGSRMNIKTVRGIGYQLEEEEHV